MAVPILTGTFPRLLEEGLHALWGHEYNSYEPEWKPVFEQRKSDRNYEDLQGVFGLDVAPQKDEGSSVAYDSGGQGFVKRFNHLVYALGTKITEEAIEDGKYIDMSSYHTKEMMKALMETDEILAANIINRATTSGYTGADGIVLASASHVYMNGGTYTNLITAAALSEVALEDMLIVCSKFKNERQNPRRVNGELLVIPPELVFRADRILKSVSQGDTALNNINAIKSRGMIPKGTHVMRRLTSTTAHFIKTDSPLGFIMFNRRSPNYKADVDFDSGTIKMKASSRRSFGWVDPHCLVYNGGA